MSEKLTKEQKEIVREIVKQAKELGINPEFAVALANLESSFSHVPASDKESTAFGPFQVNKATAEANGVDYDEMKKDKSLAIKTGLMNLIRHSKNPDLMSVNPETGEKEVDPARIIAAHRYGENSEFARTGDPKTIDPTLRSYMRDVAQHFPEQTFPTAVYVPPVAKEAEPAAVPASDVKVEDKQTPMGYLGEKASSLFDVSDMPKEVQAMVTAPVGAAVGATTGSVKYPVQYLWHKIADDAAAHEAAAQAASAEAPSSPYTPRPAAQAAQVADEAPAMTRTDRQVQGGVNEQGMTGRERQAGYTERTGQIAARRANQEAIAKSQGLNVNRPMAEMNDVASTKSGVLAGKASLDEIELQRQRLRDAMQKRALQKAQAVGSQWQQLQAQIEADKAAKLAQASKWYNRAGRAVSNFGKTLPGTLGSMGFGAGAMVPAAVEDYQKGNISGALSDIGMGAGIGYAAARAPTVVAPLAAAARIAYQATHPREVAAEMRYHDINPTAFIGMPEESEYAFPEYRK